MLRWLIVLGCFSVLTGLLSWGFIPTQAIGMTRILFGVFVTLFTGSLIVSIIRG